jgi:hypothetical protein
MTRYHTYLDDSTQAGQATILGVQQNGSEYGVGITSSVQVENLNVLNSVGIGTTNPTSKLHISGSPGTLLRIDGGIGGTGTRDIVITEFNTTAYGGIIRYDSVADLFTVGTITNSTVVNAINITRDSGNVGIGITNPGNKLHVAGGIRNTSRNVASTQTALHINTTTGDIAETASSRRFKRNIQDYTKGLETLTQLRPVSFQFLEDDLPNTGLIAEEVHEAGLPEFIRYDADENPYSIPYDNLSALYINAIKELSEKVNDIITRLENLESQINTLKYGTDNL